MWYSAMFSVECLLRMFTVRCLLGMFTALCLLRVFTVRCLPGITEGAMATAQYSLSSFISVASPARNHSSPLLPTPGLPPGWL